MSAEKRTTIGELVYMTAVGIWAIPLVFAWSSVLRARDAIVRWWR